MRDASSIRHSLRPNADRARTVITRSGAIVRGKFPSRKNGRMIHHEGLLELDACYLFEMLPCVLAYREQPIKLRYPDGDRLRTYTPDFELTLITGKRVLVEIKHSSILARKDISEKYGKIARHLCGEGIDYVIITEDIIRIEPRLTTLRIAATALTFPRPPGGLIRSIVAPLLGLESVTISKVDEHLKHRGITASDLMAAGYMAFDLNTEVSLSTTVSINEEPDHEWPRISEELPF